MNTGGIDDSELHWELLSLPPNCYNMPRINSIIAPINDHSFAIIGGEAYTNAPKDLLVFDC